MDIVISKLKLSYRRRNFIEHSIAHLLSAMEHSAAAEETAQSPGLLQRLDPRVKVVGLLALLISAALSHRLSIILGIFTVAIILALLSRVSLLTLAKRGWVGALLFSGMIALPAAFITPGRVIGRLPLLDWPVTAQGLTSAVLLVSRVETAVTLSLLLVLCTPWAHVLKALRVLGVPVALVVILGMTYRYIFLLLAVARDLFEARQSRMVGALDAAEARRFATSSIGVLLGKSLQLSNEVHLAMLSRGFRGEVHTLNEFTMRSRDWIGLIVFAVFASLAVWLGR